MSVGWGIARQRAFKLLLRLTCQSIECEEASDGKPVSEKFRLDISTSLIMMLASGTCHSMGSGDDHPQRRRCHRQNHSWSSLRKRFPSPYGITTLHIA